VYAAHTDVGELDWGQVTVWERGGRLVHTFTLAQDPGHPTEVVVEFEPSDTGSVVRHAHGGWNEDNVADRKKFGDWPVLLDRFAALAEGRS
jgi:Activator of Hsp90 ATPase homolog 1-like protein